MASVNNRKAQGVRRKRGRGRPVEGRVAVTCLVLPEIRTEIRGRIDMDDRNLNTVGKVIEQAINKTSSDV